MFSSRFSIHHALNSFRLEDRAMCYSKFAPRLFNWCLELGFTPGQIMPSRAFCSDESQGFPIILLTKHFGAFPFNHGRVGGIVSTDRHGPHAEHGKDLVLIQASHVGYDPASGKFGNYRRVHTEDAGFTCNCGKIGHTLERYADEYRFASNNIRLLRHNGRPALTIDNQLLSRTRTEGLFLVTDNLIEGAVKRVLPHPITARSTGNTYEAASSLVSRLGDPTWPSQGSRPIGQLLAAEDFYYRRALGNEDTFKNQLEYNLIPPMPWIVTAQHPLLAAACANTLAEFDRTYRSLAQTPVMRGKNVLFLAGINIDISPDRGDHFPLTKFVPWAAYLQRADGHGQILEQDELLERLGSQPTTNPSQFDLEHAIETMVGRGEVQISLGASRSGESDFD